LVVGVVSALVQLGPVLGRGYVLTRDLVFVPGPPITRHLLGVDGLPRAVPSDLVVALLSHVVPGDLVEDLVLFAVLSLAGWGAARLVPTRSPVAAAAAALLYSWNPYVAERLRQGQWAVLVGVAALPWVASAAIGLRRRAPYAAARVVLVMSLAAIGGASAELLAALVLVPIVAWPGPAVRPPMARPYAGRLLVATAAVVLPGLAWFVPSVTQAGSPPSDTVGAAVFAARPDTPLGTVPSILGLGGIWNGQAVPPGRDTVVVGLAALLLSIASVTALWLSRSRWNAGDLGGVLTAGAVSLAVSLWGVTPGLRVGLAHLVASTSAAGLLRDGQRWLAPFVLLVAVGFGLVVEAAAARARPAAAVLALAPALLLPAAAWGGDGALHATRWPGDWVQVRSAAARLPPGPILVLPWSAVRVNLWNGDRVIADPTDRWIGRLVVGDDALDVGGVTTPVEAPLARRLAVAATGHADLSKALRANGFAGVLIQRDQPGAAGAVARTAGLPTVVETPLLLLKAVPAAAAVAPPAAPVLPALLAEIVGAATLAAAATGCVIGATKRRVPCKVTPTRRHHPSADTEVDP
jgi:hypothetical protein